MPGSAQPSRSYIEVASGLNYVDENGQWAEAQDLIELTYDGRAAALRGQTKLYAEANLNSAGAVTLVTVGKQVLRTHILGIGYYDASTGKAVLLSRLKDSLGELLPPNQIVWRSAFASVQADVLLTYSKAAVECDVIIREQPPAPESFGLDPSTTRFEVWHEWLDSPTPRVVSRLLASETDPVKSALMAEPDLTDQTLDFGEAWFPTGAAYVTDSNTQRSAETPAQVRVRNVGREPGLAPVAKTWVNAGMRTFLVEAVRWSDMQPNLQKLPSASVAIPFQTPQDRMVCLSLLPAPQPALASAAPITRAAAEYAPLGFTIDWIEVTGYDSYTFTNGVTYLLGSTYFQGTVTINGGAVLKYAQGGRLLCYGSFLFNSSGGSPAIFTSKDEDLFGTTLPSSTHSATYAANPAIWDYYQPTAVDIHGVRIRWATTAVQLDANGDPCSGLTHTFFDSSIEFCQTGIYANNGTVSIANCGVCSVDVPTTIPEWAADCTYFSGGFNNTCSGDYQGIPLSWLCQYFGSAQPAAADPDGDGLTNIEEYRLGYNPTNPHTGGSVLSDGDKDFDGDGITNGQEHQAGTDPTLLDSNGNGLSDSEESEVALRPVNAYFMRIISRDVLELVRFVSGSEIDSKWPFANNLPLTNEFQVFVNYTPYGVQRVGFKQRPYYWAYAGNDSRVEKSLYLQLATKIPDVENSTYVLVTGNRLENLQFKASYGGLRYSPAIHVNQEGYPAQIDRGGTIVAAPQKAVVGYYCGSLVPESSPMTITTAAYQPSGQNQPTDYLNITNETYGPVALQTAFGSPCAEVNLTRTLNNNLNGWVGFKFVVGAAGTQVTHLGRWVFGGDATRSRNTNMHTVKIINGDGSAVNGASVTVNTASNVPGRFAWAQLQTPVALTNNTYYLLSSETNNGDYWYDYDSTMLPGFGQIDLSGIGPSTVKLIDAASGAIVPNFNPIITPANEAGASDSSQYRGLFQVDLNGFSQSGEYRLKVDGLGTSFPFRIGNDVLMKLARTYALGLYHQRCGQGSGGKQVNDLPFTRFLHGDCHTSPASIMVPKGAYTNAWNIMTDPTKGYANPGNANQRAPALVSDDSQHMPFPFRTSGDVDVSGGHHDAGDYSKYTINSGHFIHSLIFAVDNFPNLAALDNLGIPESGDGKSDVLQEAKWEADFLLKMQDVGIISPGLVSGGFYTLVYPRDEEYESSYLPDHGDPQIVWPKTTSVTAAAVAALAEAGSSSNFCALFSPALGRHDFTNNPYLLAAGWDFLMRACDASYLWQTNGTSGKDNCYQKCYYYGDDFMHNDELAWAAAAVFAAGYATGPGKADTNANHDPHTLLRQWYPRPDDPTAHIPFGYTCAGDNPPTNSWWYGWWGMYQGYGCAVRDYAFAVSSGRRASGELNSAYLTYCQTALRDWGHIVRSYSENNAYLTTIGAGYNWRPEFYFPGYWAFDVAVSDRLDTAAEDHSRNMAAVLGSFNFELGCNPNNVGFLPGLGWRRQRVVVNQYWYNAGRVLPPTGNPVAPINDYQLDADYYLRDVFFPPADQGNTAGFALYDRWGHAAPRESEFVGIDTARSLATAAWLAAQFVTNRTQSWAAADISTNRGLFSLALTGLPTNTTRTIQLTSTLPLSQARIIWDRVGQEPVVGNTFTFLTASTVGDDRVDAEAVFPDGRRVFASQTFPVYDPNFGGTPLQVTNGTVALYNFDNTLANQGNGRYNLTKSGNPAYTPSPAWMMNPSGAAMRFSRLDEQLTVKFPAVTFGTGTPIIVEFRILPRRFVEPSEGQAYVVYLNQSATASLVFAYPFPNSSSASVGFSGYQQVQVPMSLNQWHTMKMALAPGNGGSATLAVSVDGAQPITGSTTNHIPNATDDWTLILGQFQGDLDDLRISNQ